MNQPTEKRDNFLNSNFISAQTSYRQHNSNHKKKKNIHKKKFEEILDEDAAAILLKLSKKKFLVRIPVPSATWKNNQENASHWDHNSRFIPLIAKVKFKKMRTMLLTLAFTGQ